MSTIIDRLIRFYQAHASSSKNTIGEVWNGFINSSQHPLIVALDSGDDVAVERILKNVYTSDIILGVDSPVSMAVHNSTALIRRMGQRFGVLPMYNPEQPIATWEWNSENIIHDCEVESGVSFYLSETDKAFPSRLPVYYSALRSIQLLSCFPPKRVIEIGAGIGLLGILLDRWKVQHYSIIDIPSTAVISAYTLMRHLGEDSVRLFGETENVNAYAYIYPASRIEEAFDHQYDVVFNSDSLPEIPVDEQDKYAKEIARCGMDYFLSINHESPAHGQRSVRAMFKANSDPLRLVYRAPSFMRDGYVEEVYMQG